MVIVEIFVVPLNEYFDICVHKELYIKEVIFLLTKLLRQIKKEDGAKSSCFRLGSYSRKCIFEREKTLLSYDIREGDRLFFF